MALPKKINIPMNTTIAVPNPNNLTSESQEINRLVNLATRSNYGQNQFLSATSGKTYKTSAYPNDSNIYNRGETGMYNLFVKLYGGNGGWLLNADDYNAINPEFDIINNSISNLNTTLLGKINANTNAINVNTSRINNIIAGRESVPWGGISGKPTYYQTNWDGYITNKPSIFPTNWDNVAGKPNFLRSYNAGADYFFGSGGPSGGVHGSLYLQFV